MGYIGVITHLLTIDPNFQRDIQADPGFISGHVRNNEPGGNKQVKSLMAQGPQRFLDDEKLLVMGICYKMGDPENIRNT